jgi:hypothetical protein
MRSTTLAMLLLTMASSLAGLGCTTTFPLTADARVPFTTGRVEAVFEDDGSGQMTVRVAHLGDPGKLLPTATTYVVWLQAEGAAPQNMGVMRTGEDYAGRIKFETAFKRFRVWITPEPSGDVAAPTGREVLSGEVERP